MKKKLAFMLINMNIGGTEKAFLNLIEEIDEEEYEVDLFLLENKGGFLREIPKWIKVIIIDDYEKVKEEINLSPKENIKRCIKEKRIIKGVKLTLIYMVCKIKKERNILYSSLFKNMNINEKYDIAIAYAGPMEIISYIISEKINAKKKYQWIHFDISKIGINKKFYEKHAKIFEKFIIVSEEGKEKILNVIPSLKEKIVVKRNTIPINQIRVMAKEGEGFKDAFTGIRILTVGRISEEKGYDLAIKICEKLLKNNFNVRWYAIGEGNLKEEYIKECINRGIENSFIFLGGKINPYRYMEECDIYIQASKYEGFCITIGEVKIFKKPIITTDFTGAKEQLLEYKKGKIIGSEEEFYEAIVQEIKMILFR